MERVHSDPDLSCRLVEIMECSRVKRHFQMFFQIFHESQLQLAGVTLALASYWLGDGIGYPLKYPLLDLPCGFNSPLNVSDLGA